MINNNLKDNEILKLKDELTQAKQIIEQQKITIQNLQNQINDINSNHNITIQNYKNIINQKEQELNNLKIQLQNNDISSNNNSLYNRRNIMAVNFISMDSKIHFAVPCIDSDIFAEVEEKLYKQFPEYRETNNSFLANGQTVLRFKTIKQNKIGNGLPVTMNIPD